MKSHRYQLIMHEKMLCICYDVLIYSKRQKMINTDYSWLGEQAIELIDEHWQDLPLDLLIQIKEMIDAGNETQEMLLQTAAGNNPNLVKDFKNLVRGIKKQERTDREEIITAQENSDAMLEAFLNEEL